MLYPRSARMLAALVLALAAAAAGGLPARADGPAESYVVQPGDTLTRIAEMSGLSVARIVELNNLTSADSIFVGDTLLLAPPTSTSPPPAPSPPQPSANASRPTPAPAPQAQSDSTYQVQRGDTLYSIARKSGIAPSTLQAANELSTPDRIFVGQRLAIPPGGSVPSPSAGAGPTPAANDIVTIARQYLGAPYAFGGATPMGFDCSGFIYYVLNRAGLAIDRDIRAQYDSGPHVSRDQLQPGDLVFFQNTYMDGLSHSGIYAGNGEFINAVNEGVGVAMSKLSSAYWAERWYGGTRHRARSV